MIKVIQVCFLTFFCLSMAVSAKTASSSKSVVKDDEFNDPLLDMQSEEEASLRALEEEALEARGDLPLEENRLPDPPPVKPEDPQPVVENDSLSSEKNATPSAKAQTAPRDQSPAPVETQKTDDELLLGGGGDELAPVTEDPEVVPAPTDPVLQSLESKLAPSDQTDRTAVGPRFNPRDPQKGFRYSDDDGAYYYEESSESMERFHDNDVKIVPNPENYKRGLLSVSSDGSYYYAGEDSELTGSASVRVTQMPPIPYENQYGLIYQDFYGEKSLAVVLFDYDWLALRRFGQWVINVGAGVGTVSGVGRFIDTYDESRERYNLYVLLTHISFVYRMQYSAHPWVVPYFSGGGVPAVLYERRDDNKKSRYEFVPSIQLSGGARLNIGRFDSSGVAALDAEYGINNLWLDVEYRRLQSFSDTIDISNNLFNVGLGFDF